MRLAAGLIGIGFLAAACASAAPHPVVTAAARSSLPGTGCSQTYQQWRQGPVRAAAVRLEAEITSTRAAGRSGNAAALRTAMHPVASTALALATYPMPRCADTRGSYAAMPSAVYLAGHQARAATGLAGLLKAAATLRQAVAIERQLTAEITAVLGVTRCPATNPGDPPQPRWPPC
ncbi:MAG: hypothetical protein ACR2FU_10195 [Streptosporangiaceae bacterium]